MEDFISLIFRKASCLFIQRSERKFMEDVLQWLPSFFKLSSGGPSSPLVDLRRSPHIDHRRSLFQITGSIQEFIKVEPIEPSNSPTEKNSAIGRVLKLRAILVLITPHEPPSVSSELSSKHPHASWEFRGRTHCLAHRPKRHPAGA